MSNVPTRHDHFATVDRLRARVAELEADAAEYDRLISRQGDLLTAAVNAIRGEPEPLSLHSHHDVAELAAAVVAERDRLSAAVGEALASASNDWYQGDDGCIDSAEVLSILASADTDKVLAEIRAQAWDEGVLHVGDEGCKFAEGHEPCPYNPYRSGAMQ